MRNTSPFAHKHLFKLVNMRMPFGKFKGHLLIDIPESYLLWFAKQGFPKGELDLLLQLALEIKAHGLTSLIEPLRGKTENR